MYSDHCTCCGGLILHDLTDTSTDWDAAYSQIAKELLEGSGKSINSDLYFNTAGDLMSAVYNGLGGNSFAYDDDRNALAAALQKNIYAFSAAKSFTQMEQYRDMMIGENKKLLPFESFKKVVADQGEIFNNKYLRAEHQHAMQSAIMAHKWDSLDADYLEYSTVNDKRVREDHKKLDTFTAPKSDSIWRRIYPPLAWNCRCTVIPGKAQNSEKKMTAIEAGAMVKPWVKDTIFDNNVGLSKVIFKDDHPYFQNAKGEIHNLSWQQYGLPPLEKIRVNLMLAYKSTSKEEYLSWWGNQPKFRGDDIVVKDALNNEILLSSGVDKSKSKVNYFKDHILKKSKENRFEFGTETISILKSPDEVWQNDQGRVYLKYYEQGTLKVVVNDKLEADTIFKLFGEADLKKSRKGILLHKK